MGGRARPAGEGMGLQQSRTPRPAPWKCDTLNVAPGERWDVLVKATNPGTGAFHCHILPHAESDHGMFGMDRLDRAEAGSRMILG